MNFSRIAFSVRSFCVVCDTPLKKALIELPQFPLTEIYTDKKPKKLVGYADQYFHLCKNCGHGQISIIIDQKILYAGSTYFFRTSRSKTASKANDVFLSFIRSHIKGKKLTNIIEIGCSDLYLLLGLKEHAQKLIGIDPILKGKEQELSSEKITVIGDFFENIDVSGEIHEGQSLVISSHTLEHVVDPKKMIADVLKSATDKTLCFFQFPGFETLIADGRYDQIFHQHLQYFSVSSFCRLLDIVGGELVDYNVNYHHWGSLMVAFRKKRSKHLKGPIHVKQKIIAQDIGNGYKKFQVKMNMVNAYLQSLKGERIYGFGAALMLPILSYHLKNDFSAISCILDDDPNKEGMFYINLPLPIKKPERVNDIAQANVVVTALNTTRSILPRVLSVQPKRIIFPVDIV